MKQTLHSENGRYVLRIERRFAHPQRKVWRSITEPEHFRQWYPFSTGEMDLRVGGRLGFDDGEGTTYEAVVTELDPPRVFAFREIDDLAPFELRPPGQRTPRPAGTAASTRWTCCWTAVGSSGRRTPLSCASSTPRNSA